MNELHISATMRAAIEAHALDCFPEECCGLIVERNHRQEVVRVTNIQSELHAKDPDSFPRDARTAYAFGPESAHILIAAGKGQLRLHAFYHSHPDHDAYFSETDRAEAKGGWDEPSYPDVGQIVLSVRDGAVRAAKAFAWDETRRDFVEIPLLVD